VLPRYPIGAISTPVQDAQINAVRPVS
jgi:hypothetical protein